MSEHELSFRIIPFLDRHMVLPVLENLQEKKLYKERDLLVAKLELVSKTSMVDFGIEQYKELYETEDVPKDMQARRDTVWKKLKSTTKACGKLLEMLTGTEEKESEADKLRADKKFNRDYLKSERGITDDNIEALYPYAKLTYDCGRYQLAADTLFYYRLLTTDEATKFQALWGKLAAEILMVNVDSALDDLQELKEALESRTFSEHLQLMQQRTWLIHWGLFIFFSLEELDTAVDFFFQDKIWNTIQTNCPHLLRYVCVAAIIAGKGKKNLMRELVKVLSEEQQIYSDPVTEFLVEVYVNFDFESAQKKLDDCATIMENDCFMQHIEEGVFLTAARQLIFECSCRIHSCLDVNSLCERLQITEDKESRIISMIQESSFDGKIDSEKNLLNMEMKHPAIYAQVLDLERVKTLANRSGQLANQIEKKYMMES